MCIKLSDRLQIIADFVKPDAKIIDVGTDHGYVPVYLAQSCKVKRIIASDINELPLEKAKQTANMEGIDSVEFRLVDGLLGVTWQDVDTIIIAGMGSENIIAILEAAPWALECELILQPMSKREKLALWLRENGMKIIDEKLVREKGGIHSVLYVKRGCETDFSISGLYVSQALVSSGSPLLYEHINRLIRKTEKARIGLESSKTPEAGVKIAELLKLVTELDELREGIIHD